MGATSKTKPKKTTTKKATRKGQGKRAKPREPTPPPPVEVEDALTPAKEEAPAVFLFTPTTEAQARATLQGIKPLSAYALQKLLVKQPQLAMRLVQLMDSRLIFEADLALLLKRREVRQVVLTQTDDGWEVQILPLWKGDFLTLVSLKKEKRRYRDLDRLISTMTTHGPLPPTILIGK